MLGKACKHPRCPTVHTEKGSYCVEHQTTIDVKWSYNKPRNLFYGRKAWLVTRANKLGINPICEACSRYPAHDVHHIVRLEDCKPGQEYDLENLEALCKRCHAKHTAKEYQIKKKKGNNANNLQ